MEIRDGKYPLSHLVHFPARVKLLPVIHARRLLGPSLHRSVLGDMQAPDFRIFLLPLKFGGENRKEPEQVILLFSQRARGGVGGVDERVQGPASCLGTVFHYGGNFLHVRCTIKVNSCPKQDHSLCCEATQVSGLFVSLVEEPLVLVW